MSRCRLSLMNWWFSLSESLHVSLWCLFSDIFIFCIHDSFKSCIVYSTVRHSAIICICQTTFYLFSSPFTSIVYFAKSGGGLKKSPRLTTETFHKKINLSYTNAYFYITWSIVDLFMVLVPFICSDTINYLSHF